MISDYFKLTFHDRTENITLYGWHSGCAIPSQIASTFQFRHILPYIHFNKISTISTLYFLPHSIPLHIANIKFAY